MRLVGNTRIEWWTTVEADDRETAVSRAVARADDEHPGVGAWELRAIERVPTPAARHGWRWRVSLVEDGSRTT